MPEWQKTTFQKMDQVFRDNNEGCVPEWLDSFQEEYMEKSQEFLDKGLDYQIQFYNLVRKLTGGGDGKHNLEY